MHRDTINRIRAAAADPRTLEERIADAAADAAERTANAHIKSGHTITAPSLPSNRTTGLVTVTLDELSDLVYAAASNVLQRNTSLTKTTAQAYASRASIEAQQIAHAQGWVHRGADPRA